MSDLKNLAEKYKSISNEDLIDVINNPDNYIEGAKSIAEQELDRREINIEDKSENLVQKTKVINEQVEKNEQSSTTPNIELRISAFLDTLLPSKNDSATKKIIFWITTFLACNCAASLYYSFPGYIDSIVFGFERGSLFILGVIGLTILLNFLIIWGLYNLNHIGWILTTTWGLIECGQATVKWITKISSSPKTSTGMLGFLDDFTNDPSANISTVLIFAILSTYFLSNKVRELFKIRLIHILTVLAICLALILYLTINIA